jgi:tetratricopeptide (TPR) repeat protein
MAQSASVSRFRRFTLWALVGAGILACGAVAWRWRTSAPTCPDCLVEDDDTGEPVAEVPDYVGPEVCAACHAERVAEFKATRHFRSSRLPQAGDMPDGFEPGKGFYATRNPALRFEMTRVGGDFVQTAVQRKHGREERRSERIGLVYGAGDADEVYHYWQEDRLYRLPLAWLRPLNEWGNAPGFRDGTAEFARETTPRCLECHTTWFNHVAGTPNQYRRQHFVLGITCERCHGPGREHVAFHQTHPDADGVHAIVHPGRLSRERQLDVCAQCHSNADKHRTAPFSYRPGKALEAYFRLDVGKRPEEDHVANQGHYLRQSKCFQKSDMTCTTCHNPHQSHTASVKNSCSKCHEPMNCRDRESLPAAVRGECVACHMPQRTVMNVYFHTKDEDYVPLIKRHEHRIGIHAGARQEVLRVWLLTQTDPESHKEADHLTRSLNEKWLAEAEAYRRDYRFEAAIGAYREAVRLDPAPATRRKLDETISLLNKLETDFGIAVRLIDERRFAEAEALLREVLDIKPDLAAAHGKLGTLYASIGRNDRAVEHLQAVARHDPDSAYGQTMLGWLAYLQGRAEEAVEAYERAEEIEPFNAKINFHMALALVKLERWPEARDRFRRVLTIEPNHTEACHGLSQVLRRQGDREEALRFARRAARLGGSQNPLILVTLAETYADLGRFAEAAKAAERAQAAARAAQPGLEPQIRRRLDELRTLADGASK